MNLLLDFLKSRRSVRWLGHGLGLLAASGWMGLDAGVAVGIRVAAGFAAALFVFELIFSLLDRRSARLKALAPRCFPLKNLADDERAFVQSALAKSVPGSGLRALLGWDLAALSFWQLQGDFNSAVLATMLGGLVSALVQNRGNDLLRKRLLPFFYFEKDYAKNLALLLPSLRRRFFGSVLAPCALFLLPLMTASVLGHAIGWPGFLWVLAWGMAAVFGSVWVLEVQIVEPLQDLSEALNRFGKGDFQALLDVTSGDEVGLATETYNKTLRAVDRRIFVLERFGHAVSPGKSDALFEGGLRLDGELRPLALLECVWQGADSATKDLEAPARLSTLNRFYEVVQDAVDKAQGSVLRLGEGRILACWGAPLADEQAVQGALAAAWNLQSQLKVWASQHRLRSASTPAPVWSLGVSSGQATVGLLGPRQRQTYAVLGGPLNELRALLERPGGPWLDERSAGAAKAPFAVQVTQEGPQLCAGPEPESPSAQALGFEPGAKL